VNGISTAGWWARLVLTERWLAFSICGMHYLGDKAINNYQPVHSTINVVASVVIAIVATNVALTLFFVVRKNFTNSWWKRVLLAFLLASAVSGMHWTANLGTTFIVKRERPNGDSELSRQWVVIIVIALVRSPGLSGAHTRPIADHLCRG
jgi:NO-binding membrane sensor protein with MHYT domain